MPTTKVNGLDVAYERAGSGPPLVLLHGIGSNKRSWRYQLAQLSDEFTVVAWDAPGFGGSSDPPAGTTMDDQAAYLDGLLDNLGFDQAHICGLSWGGLLAQVYYRHYPQRVQSLVLADTFSGGRSRSEEARQQNLQMRLRMAEEDPIEMSRKRAPALLSPNAPAQLVDEVASIAAERHAEGYRIAAIASSEADTRDVHPTIRVPTLVIWGEFDGVTSREEAELMRDHIPDAQLVVIQGAGHVSNQEQPAQFNDAVRTFLRLVRPSPAAGTARH
jgi:pimeloyl-ACP methyl ester carboxylesterase